MCDDGKRGASPHTSRTEGQNECAISNSNSDQAHAHKNCCAWEGLQHVLLASQTGGQRGRYTSD
eukprot:9351-Pelagomonas_calceolata.AAC.1